MGPTMDGHELELDPVSGGGRGVATKGFIQESKSRGKVLSSLGFRKQL